VTDSKVKELAVMLDKYVTKLNQVKEEATREIKEYHEKSCNDTNREYCTGKVVEEFLNTIYMLSGTVVVKYQKVIRASDLLKEKEGK
jgi:hypothetical protein